MCDHIFDQYTNAQTKMNAAEKQVAILTTELKSKIDLIHKSWETVSFSYTKPDGTIVKGNTSNDFNLDTIRSTFMRIDESLSEYRKAKSLLSSLSL